MKESVRDQGSDYGEPGRWRLWPEGANYPPVSGNLDRLILRAIRESFGKTYFQIAGDGVSNSEGTTSES